jgi:outer membrane protein assembly factor BamB
MNQRIRSALHSLTAMRVLTGLFGLTCVTADAGNWPQWRGPARTCEIGEPAEWPQDLSETALKQTFRIPLGESYSGPIVTSDRVFVTETVDKKNEVVRALDRHTGAEIWKVEWPGAMTVPFFAASNGSWIRSTPACDENSLYVAGIRDVLVSLDLATGKENWRVDFTKEFNTDVESFGFVCSPLLDEGCIYVQTAGGLVKLNCSTGAILWRGLKESGGMMGGAFSSPIIAEVAGFRQLVVQTRSRLVGVDPETGAELWGVDIPSFRGMNILTPVVLGDRVFTSSYGGGSAMVQVSRVDTGFEVKEAWKKTVEAYMSSPVIVDGKIYLHLRNQRFTCIDPETGETLWTTKPFGKYWSMAVNGKQLLVLDERGELLLVEANPAEYRQIASRQVSDASTWAHIGISGRQVFVRELNALTVYEWGS